MAANTFEGGTSGVTVSAGNSGGVSGTAFNAVGGPPAGGTLVYDDAQEARGGGSLALKVATVATAGQASVQWTTAVGTSMSRVAGRLYVYLTAFPTPTVVLVSFSSPTRASITLQAGTGRIYVTDSAFASGGLYVNAVPLNQWVRIEWDLFFHVSAGTAWTGMFYGDAVTPIETQVLTGRAYGGVVSTILIGSVATTANAGPFWIDDVEANLLAAPGPSVPVPQAEGATTSSAMSAMRR